jgi:hypothetical protein
MSPLRGSLDMSPLRGSLDMSPLRGSKTELRIGAKLIEA